MHDPTSISRNGASPPRSSAANDTAATTRSATRCRRAVVSSDASRLRAGGVSTRTRESRDRTNGTESGNTFRFRVPSFSMAIASSIARNAASSSPRSVATRPPAAVRPIRARLVARRLSGS